MKITTNHASDSPVTIVSQTRFAILFFLPSFYGNSLLMRELKNFDNSENLTWNFSFWKHERSSGEEGTLCDGYSYLSSFAKILRAHTCRAFSQGRHVRDVDFLRH